jgi:glycosyltransferase involved in cell wall biosynthesis
MSKPLCVVSCPADTYSGYGARARDFVKALVKAKPDWDIKILSQRWGNTRFGYLEDHKEFELKARIIPQMTQQPDYWFQITVPNEFQRVGKVYSCGVTAGIETTVCDPSWIEGVNRMDITLVSSQHAKKVFTDNKFEKKDPAGNTVALIQLEKPVEVLFEGADLTKYFFIDQKEYPKNDLTEELDQIPEKFCYLFVGHWLQGVLGEDRKNVGLLIQSFLNSYKNKPIKPALILKTSMATNCIMDRDEMLSKIDAIRQTIDSKDLPNIYLLHGDLEDTDINLLYNHSKVKAMISLTKGEGFGRPLLEFTLSKKLVIATDWSGHKDFLDPRFTYLVPGEIKQIHPSAVMPNMLLAESGWFAPSEIEIGKMWQEVFKNYSKYEEFGKRQGHRSKTEFSFDKMAEVLSKIIDTKFDKPKVLKLPELKKIELPKLNKI